MSDGLEHDILLIVTVIVFISFVLGSGGEQEGKSNDNGEGNVLPKIII